VKNGLNMALAGQSGDIKATVSGRKADGGCLRQFPADEDGLAAADASDNCRDGSEGAMANAEEGTTGSDLPAGWARTLLVLALAEAYCALCRPDIYLSLVARSALSGRLARVSLPGTADEKFAWRKFFDRDPRLTLFSDKLAAKDWVRGLAPDLDIPETLWTGTSTQSIPFDLLGPETVLKANHATGMNMFFGDTLPNRSKILGTAAHWLGRVHGRRTYEWGYFAVPPRLFIERRIRAKSRPFEDIKVYTFGSRIERVVRLRPLEDGRREGQTWAPDADGNLVDLRRKPGAADIAFDAPPPDTWARAMHVASVIGAHFDHARIDLLSDGDRLWFGEITMYNHCGTLIWDTHDPDVQIARAWDLRRTDFLRNPPTRGWRARYAAELARALERRAVKAPPLPPQSFTRCPCS